MTEVQVPVDEGAQIFGEPFTPELRANPHPLYHQKRRDSPRFHIPEEGVWLLTRYADC
jgi:hypothetical protein